MIDDGKRLGKADVSETSQPTGVLVVITKVKFNSLQKKGTVTCLNTGCFLMSK